MENLNLNDISYLIGIVLSVASENIPQLKLYLDKLAPKQRFFMQLFAVVLVVLGVNLLSCQGVGVMECLNWQVLIDGVVSWSIGQVVYWGKKDIM